jgi:soluble lytic murein transglycosylase
MAAYNAGPNKVHKWINQGIWDGTRQNVSQIPYEETRQYVQRVSFFYEKYKQLYSDLPKNKHD